MFEQGTRRQDTVEEIRARIERCKERAEDPAFKANAAKLAAEECSLRAYVRDARRRILGIPAEHQDHMDSPRESEALIAARAWRNVPYPDRPLFLLLGGPLGRGKSFAAAWCVDQLGGRFVGSAEMAALKFNEGEVESVLKAPCLALDDFGMEASDAGGWTASHLFRVLADRYSEKRPTVITTNVWGPDLEAKFGGELKRLWDRVLSSGRFVFCGGDSMRGQKP
jgi:DNA replication protein DnaC